MFSTSKFLVNPPSTVVTDPYFRYTTLLLNDTGTNGAQNNTFISANYGAVSAVGGYAGYFDGTGDYLSTPNVAALRLGAGDFTVESWIYPFRITNTYLSAICGTYGYVSSADRGWAFYLNSTGYLTLIMYGSSGSGFTLASSTITPNNSWSHVAAVRSGTTVTLYLNGVSVATGTSSKDEDYSVVNFNIATVRADTLSPATGNAGQSFQGYLNNLRIVKGTAVYTGNFTPPTSPLTAISGTSLLTCQSATFVDNSPNNFPLTVNGNAVVSTASNSGMVINRNGNTTQGSFNPYMPTGYWGGYFDGNGDYLTIPYNSVFDFGTGNFTIECWFYPTSVTGYQMLCTKQPASTTALAIQLRLNNTALEFVSRSSNLSGTITLSGGTVSINSWSHAAIVKNSGTLTLYLNGVSVATASSSNDLTGSYPFYFGVLVDPSLNYYFNGYISNARIVKGTAVYTSAFTPPTTPLTAITNTSLLCLQNNRFKDNSANNFTITPSGDTRVTHFNPFAPPASYTTSAYSGSGYFDGSGDYLQTAYSSNLDLPNDFTIEAWICLLNTTGGAMVIKRTTAAPAAPYNLGFGGGSGNVIYFSFSGSTNGSWNINSSFTPGTKPLYVGTWNHVAAVKSGTTITTYVNGVSDQVFTGIGTQTYTLTEGITIGANDNSGGGAIKAYMSQLRIVKGTAVYTSNFTPPTTPLTAISGTQLLLDYSNAGIYDATAINNLETVGDAKVSTAQAKWGASSMAFDNVGDYLAFPSANELTLGTGSYTVECWIYNLELVDSNTLFTWWNSGTDRRNVHIGATYINYASQSALYIHVLHGMVINQWYHIALTYDGTTTRIFVNGVVKGTYAGTQMFTAPAPFYIGAGGSSLTTDYFYGYIEDFRVTKGIARYTANFTPPTAAFPTR